MIFFNSQKLIDSLIKDIEQSQISVDIEVYILEADKIGKLFEQALVGAVKRGVKVRLMVDRIGSFDWITTRMDLLIATGVEVRVFRPIPGFKNLIKYLPELLFPFFRMLNRRNHRKVFIIDKEIAYVGSLNLMEPALKWKEATIRIEDLEDIDLLLKIYDYTWKWIKDAKSRFLEHNFGKLILRVSDSKMVRTTQTPALRRHYRNDFSGKISSAKNRVWLMTPYFNPPRFLLKALVEAVERGVDVRLVVPQITDPAWFGYLSRVYFLPLIKRNIRVYKYMPGILHSKIALIDSEGMIGSGNLNYRSFYRDLELNLILKEPKDIEDLENEFIEDMEKSHQINKSDQLSTWEKVFGSFLTIFKTSF